MLTWNPGMIDIDNLEAVSETMGYAAGNAVLQAFGKFLLSQIRSSDVGCRLGGNEFIMLLPEASLEDTANRAELFRMGGKNIRVLFGGHHLKTMTLSIGVAAFPQHGESVEELVEAVGKALAQARAKGRDQVVVAEPN